MNTDNLVSISKLQNDIKNMKLLSFLLTPEMRKQIKDMEQQLDYLIGQATSFNDRFSSYGWCAYESMDISLMENANTAFENQGLEAAEQVLTAYYKSNDLKQHIPKIRHSSEAFAIRNNLIQQFFEDHFAGRYHASVPLGLIIVDGAVNDFTKSKGFFADGTAVDAWDCLVGCSDSLTKLKNIFNQNRTKTNTEPITFPYRNGILHGRDLNYSNEFVSCKCVALMFAVADWMQMKNSEETRKERYEKSVNPPPIKDSLARMQENKQIKTEIAAWKRRTVTIGTDIPASGTLEEYADYPYVLPLIEMLYAWNNKNYGKLSNYLRKLFAPSSSDKKRAGECRKLFENKVFDAFELIEIEERACALSKIVVKVYWTSNGCKKEGLLTFGCSYENASEQVAIPWRNNGIWVLIPWDVRALYL